MAVSTAATLACLLVALSLYHVGFTSVGWETFPGFFIDGSTRSSPIKPATAWLGLWSTCVCASAQHDYKDTAWFMGSQAMLTIASMLLIGGGVTLLLHMFAQSLASYKYTLFRLCTGLLFAAVVFMVIGFTIYGTHHQFHFNWSFGVSIIGSILTLVTGLLAIVQMRDSNAE